MSATEAAELLTTAFQLGTAAAAMVFCGKYALTSWWRRPAGRNVMALTAIIGTITVVALLRDHLPTACVPFVRAACWGAVLAVLSWRVVVLFRVQRGAPLRKDHSS